MKTQQPVATPKRNQDDDHSRVGGTKSQTAKISDRVRKYEPYDKLQG